VALVDPQYVPLGALILTGGSMVVGLLTFLRTLRRDARDDLVKLYEECKKEREQWKAEEAALTRENLRLLRLLMEKGASP